MLLVKIMLCSKLHYFRVFRLELFFYKIRDSGFGIRDSGFGTRDSGFGIQDSGFEIRDSGFGIQDSRFEIRDSGFGILESVVARENGEMKRLGDERPRYLARHREHRNLPERFGVVFQRLHQQSTVTQVNRGSTCFETFHYQLLSR